MKTEEKKSGQSRVTRIIMAIVLALVVSGQAIPALATGNTTDTPYSFTFTSGNNTQHSTVRAKLDNTECYIRFDGMSVPAVNLYIYGSYTDTSNLSAWTNYTGGGVARAYGSYQGGYLIHNYVYEMGRNYACLVGYVPDHPICMGYVYGEWSPDTTMSGLLPYLN